MSGLLHKGDPQQMSGVFRRHDSFFSPSLGIAQLGYLLPSGTSRYGERRRLVPSSATVTSIAAAVITLLIWQTSAVRFDASRRTSLLVALRPGECILADPAAIVALDDGLLLGPPRAAAASSGLLRRVATRLRAGVARRGESSSAAKPPLLREITARPAARLVSNGRGADAAKRRSGSATKVSSHGGQRRNASIACVLAPPSFQGEVALVRVEAAADDVDAARGGRESAGATARRKTKSALNGSARVAARVRTAGAQADHPVTMLFLVHGVCLAVEPAVMVRDAAGGRSSGGTGKRSVSGSGFGGSSNGGGSNGSFGPRQAFVGTGLIAIAGCGSVSRHCLAAGRRRLVAGGHIVAHSDGVVLSPLRTRPQTKGVKNEKPLVVAAGPGDLWVQTHRRPRSFDATGPFTTWSRRRGSVSEPGNGSTGGRIGSFSKSGKCDSGLRVRILRRGRRLLLRTLAVAAAAAVALTLQQVLQALLLEGSAGLAEVPRRVWALAIALAHAAARLARALRRLARPEVWREAWREPAAAGAVAGTVVVTASIASDAVPGLNAAMDAAPGVERAAATSQ
ncbi:unnamed protein product [Phaeothamnion confervicola]